MARVFFFSFNAMNYLPLTEQQYKNCNIRFLFMGGLAPFHCRKKNLVALRQYPSSPPKGESHFAKFKSHFGREQRKEGEEEDYITGSLSIHPSLLFPHAAAGKIKEGSLTRQEKKQDYR